MDIPENGIPYKDISSSIDVRKIQQAIAADSTHLGICPAFSRIRPQFDIHAFATLPSTNTHLWNLLNDGAKAGTVVIAEQQSAGKGQRYRQWTSEAGGLYLSLALEPDWPVSRSPLLTCLSAWGIATAFNNLGIPIEIKWPNDLFYKGKKLGGILTETKLSQTPSIGVEASPTPDSKDANVLIKQAVIGVGINWHNQAPHSGINLAKILEIEEGAKEERPGKTGKNKINCLEVLSALVLRGILQGYFFQQQVSSQDFMKAYQKLLTQVGHSVSLDTDGLLSLATQVPGHPLHSATLSKEKSWANRSGEVVGVSEEGYLQVAMHGPQCFSEPQCSSDSHASHSLASSATNILLFKPSEIHIS